MKGKGKITYPVKQQCLLLIPERGIVLMEPFLLISRRLRAERRAPKGSGRRNRKTDRGKQDFLCLSLLYVHIYSSTPPTMDTDQSANTLAPALKISQNNSKVWVDIMNLNQSRRLKGFSPQWWWQEQTERLSDTAAQTARKRVVLTSTGGAAVYFQHRSQSTLFDVK